MRPRYALRKSSSEAARSSSRAPGQEPDAGHGFIAPVEVQGTELGVLVVDGDAVLVRRARDALTTVAAQLALAIERERLLESERDAAEALAERNAQLVELDRMKDQFVSSVSHELRTPLTSMVGYLELLMDGEAGELGEEQTHFLEIVNRNCLRLNRLVDDILFVAARRRRPPLARAGERRLRRARRQLGRVRESRRGRERDRPRALGGAGPSRSSTPTRSGSRRCSTTSSRTRSSSRPRAAG